MHDAVLSEIVPAVVKLLPAGLAVAALSEVVPLAVKLLPAGQHPAVRPEIVAEIVDCLPALLRDAVVAEEVPVAFQHEPAGLHRAVEVQVVEAAAVIEPSGLHGAVRRGIVEFAAVGNPADFEGTALGEVIPLAVNLPPAEPHFAARRLKVALGTIDLFKAAGVNRAVVLQIVGVLAVENQRILLHAVVFVVVPDAVKLFPAVRRNLVREVDKLEVNVHIALYARDRAGVRALPHHIAIILRRPLVGGDPDRVLRERGHVEFVLNPVVVRVENRIVTGVADLLAEGVYNRRNLRFRKRAERFLIFRVKGNRVGNRIVLDELQNEVCLLLGLFGRGRVGVDVGTDFDTGFYGLLGVFAKLRIGVPFVAGAEHHKVHIVRARLIPVDVALPVAHIHAAVQHAVNRGAPVKEAIRTAALTAQFCISGAVRAQAE